MFHIVRYDQVHIFGEHLRLCIFNQVFRFHGKTNQDPFFFLFSDLGNNIGIPLQVKCPWAIFLLYFGVSTNGRPIIGNGCGFDDDGGLLQIFHDSMTHFNSSRNRHIGDPSWHGQYRGSADQYHRRTSSPCPAGQGITHFPGGIIRNKSNGVKRFTGRTCGYQNRFSDQIFFRQDRFHLFDDIRQFGKPSHSFRFTGQFTRIRLHHMVSPGGKFLDVFPDDDIFIHICVHGRTDEHRCFRSHDHRSQEIIG